MAANKRMFARDVVESARFLKMPATSQLLYFHLGIEADDDGIVEAFKVLRTTNLNEDDLRVLHSKGFVVILNDDLVTYIIDWLKSNNLRADRKKDSIYQQLLIEIIPNVELLERKEKKKVNLIGGHISNECMTNDSQMSDNSQLSIVETSLEENSIGKSRLEKKFPNGSLKPYKVIDHDFAY